VSVVPGVPQAPPQEAVSEVPAPASRPGARALTPYVLLVALLGLGIGYAATRGHGGPSAPASGAIPVETLLFQPVTSYLTTHAFTGRLSAPQRTSLGFERGGRVIGLGVRDGQEVEAGATLAWLDSGVAVAQLDEARGRLAAARALLSELVAGPRPEELDSARQRVKELGAQLELARLTRERQERLARKGVISPEGNDAARTQEEAARARLAQAKNTLLLLERGTRREQVLAQEAAVRALEGTLATLSTTLDQCTLVAPFAGRVGLIEADAGTVVRAGAPVLSLTERGPLEAWVGVPPGPAAAIAPGSQQLLVIEGRRYSAKVNATLPELDRATRTRTLILSLEDSEGLVPEQIVRLVLPRELPCAGGWVPLAALSEGERAVWSVFVAAAPDRATPESAAQERIVERRLVEVIHTEPERVLIRGNLQPGEAVIATGVHRVVPGQRVSLSQ
jgi:RND family efflux transporter MFP subunit